MNCNHPESKDDEEIEIACKKRKLHEDSHSVKKKASMDEEDVNPNAISINPVLADEYLKPMETENMYIGKIIDKKETSRLIKELSAVWPVGNHLKRVRWTAQKGIFEILLCPAPQEPSSDLRDVVGGRPIHSQGMGEEVGVARVASRPPLTNAQYRQAMAHWPVQFRENKYVECVLSGDLFSPEDKKDIGRFMRLCQDTARHGDEPVGCVIVDPDSRRVVATAHDCRGRHPLQHAVMVATDLVARGQGGGAWNIQSPHISYKPCSRVDPKDLDPEDAKDPKKLSLPYLCTGYDAYISREPCVMCGMALVHSRIRRVFYASPVPWGCLASHRKLHLLQGLNHHYEAFRVSS